MICNLQADVIKKDGIKDKAKCSETETKANKRTQNKKVQFVHSYKIEKTGGVTTKEKNLLLSHGCAFELQKVKYSC